MRSKKRECERNRRGGKGIGEVGRNENKDCVNRYQGGSRRRERHQEEIHEGRISVYSGSHVQKACNCLSCFRIFYEPFIFLCVSSSFVYIIISSSGPSTHISPVLSSSLSIPLASCPSYFL